MALLSPLWKQGAGSYQIEQTAGRWIAYRATQMGPSVKGVVAYRQKRVAALPTSASTPAPGQRFDVDIGPATDIREGPPGPLDLPTLRMGAGMPPAAPSGDVKLLQTSLGIASDGRFGKGTRQALKDFQRANGLTQDGVCGPKTWAALFADNTVKT